MADDHPVFRSLLSPADCAVILIGGTGFAAGSACRTGDDRLTALLAAAGQHGVPALVLVRAGDGPTSARWPSFSFRALNPLADTEVRRALAQFNRPRLILGGGKAETSLTFAVLCALEEGYDVHLLRDLVRGGSESLVEVAAVRMVQAGAVPVTVPQVVAEWGCGREWTEARGALRPVA